jgi:hypothetical protein
MWCGIIALSGSFSLGTRGVSPVAESARERSVSECLQLNLSVPLTADSRIDGQLPEKRVEVSINDVIDTISHFGSVSRRPISLPKSVLQLSVFEIFSLEADDNL